MRPLPSRRALFLVAAVAALAAVPACRAPREPAPKEPTKPTLRDETRTPWSRAAAGYLRTWLLCGEFPNPPHEGDEHYDHTPPCIGLETDYLKAHGGEASVQPVAGTAVERLRTNGSAATWFEHASPRDVVDLKAAFQGRPTTDVVAYAYASVERGEAGKAFLAVGSDDGVRIWLNGELVHDHLVSRGVRPDEDLVAVTLRKGTNRLLLKVEQGGGGWGFACRVLEPGQLAALAAGEIRPRIEKPPPDKPTLLVVNTDAGLGRALPDPAPVLVEVLAPGGVVRQVARTAQGKSVSSETEHLPDGPYEVRVSRVVPAGHRIVRHLPWYKGDWPKQARRLLDEADKPPPGPPGLALRRKLLAAIVLDRLGRDPRAGRGPNAKSAGWRKIHSPLMEHAELDGGDVRPCGFVRLAWRDDVDGSAQFARAYLPPGYEPKQTWPLVVVLHGYNPRNPPYIRWWGATSRHQGIAERHGVVVLEPHGRGNTSYNGIGDRDVLTAIRLAKSKFSIDDTRVYLTGYSMGGGGTWHVGTRHPELFAAIGPIYGGWDYHVWAAEDEPARLTPRNRFFQESSSSFAQAEQLLTTPVFVNHGDDDSLVDVDHSRYAVKLLQRWGYPIRYWEHPGKGHGRLGCEDELVRWFLAHRRNANPRRVRVRSPRLKTAAAHWVRVEQRQDPFAFIEVDARVADRHTVRLDTANVLQLRLSPAEPLVDRSRPVRVLWNGEDAGAHPFTKGAVTLRAKGYTPAKLHKSPQIEGPIGDAATTPFAIVVGTASKSPAMRRFCQLRAQARRDQWETWQHVRPRCFLDTEITDKQIETYSLILYGGPDENLVTRKLIEHIPLTIEPDAITVAGQRFAAKDAAVGMVYPHPRNAARCVAIHAGNSPAGMFFANQLDDGFDFVISDARIHPDDDVPGEKLRIVAGYFDRDWQYAEAFAIRGDDEVRAQAVRRKAPAHLTAAVDAERLYLSDVLEAKSAGSFANMQRDRNWQGKPITLAGKTYGRGIGVRVWHQPCTATYDLAGAGWTRLRATLGIELDRKPDQLEEKHKRGTRVYFVVAGDGKQLYRSPTFRWDSAPVEMDVGVAGVKTLELKVANEVAWHNAASSVDWAGLRLER